MTSMVFMHGTEHLTVSVTVTAQYHLNLKLAGEVKLARLDASV